MSISGVYPRVLRVCVLWQPHIRTPGYLFGCPGEVVEVVGVFEDAELAAFREIDAKQPLYRVKFSQATVWANAGLKYEGSVLDTLVVDVVQPWLMPQSAEFVHSTPAPVVKPTEGCAPHSHGDHHHHDDAEPLSDAPHARPEVEQAAVEREGVEPRFKAWAESLLRLLVDKGVVTYDAVNSAATSQAAVLGQCRGPRIVARAWTDPEFKARLLANAHEAAAELGVDATNPAAPTVLHAVENTSTLHNVIVCTLCSCYPQAILGLSPQWYRSRSYRARCVRDPRSVLKEFGTVIPDGVEVRVHDSTSELRYIVIPQRPPGTEGLTEDQLASLVTRDSMIGVSFALSPDAASNLSAK
jgi:nitrile hydratase subunit alpha